MAANLRPEGRLAAMSSNFGPGVPVAMSCFGWMPSDPKPLKKAFLHGPDSFEIQNDHDSHVTHEVVRLAVLQ